MKWIFLGYEGFYSPLVFSGKSGIFLMNYIYCSKHVYNDCMLTSWKYACLQGNMPLDWYKFSGCTIKRSNSTFCREI